MKKRLIYVLTGITLIISFSCKKYLTVQPSGYISTEQNFKVADDAITSVYGLYSLMQPLVDQIFLAGEAQADLVVAARGADQYIAEIAQNRITPQNPYTDYTKFYKLIVACNNTLVGLEKITRADPINYTSEMYRYNVAEVIYIRAWTYLQMAKIWGDVPYIDYSVTTTDDLKSIPAAKLDTILSKIQNDAVKYYPTIQLLALSPGTNGTIPTGDVSVIRAQFNNYAAQCMLAEIYVYNGNYSKAKDLLSSILPYGQATNASFGIFGLYNGSSGAAAFDYGRWPAVFSNGATDARALYISFDGTKGQTNSLERWTNNNVATGGVYALKPSSNALRNWKEAPNMLLAYQNQNLGYFINLNSNNTIAVLQPDGTPILGSYGDFVRGDGASYMSIGSDTIIFKYLMRSRGVIKNAVQNDPNSHDDAEFIIYRDGPMYLFDSEIYNHVGLSNQALGIINGGLENSGFKGTRYRARLMPLQIDPAGGDVVKQVDKLMLQEKALEAAFEGQRWFDLVRISKINNDPSILANAVAQKYPANQRAAIIARLSNPNYWYFPFYQRNIDNNKLLKQKAGY